MLLCFCTVVLSTRNLIFFCSFNDQFTSELCEVIGYVCVLFSRVPYVSGYIISAGKREAIVCPNGSVSYEGAQVIGFLVLLKILIFFSV